MEGEGEGRGTWRGGEGEVEGRWREGEGEVEGRGGGGGGEGRGGEVEGREGGGGGEVRWRGRGAGGEGKGRWRGEKRGRGRGRARGREWEEREGEGGRGPHSECVVSSQCITTHLVPKLFPRITRRSLCTRLVAVMIKDNGYKAIKRNRVVVNSLITHTTPTRNIPKAPE